METNLKKLLDVTHAMADTVCAMMCSPDPGCINTCCLVNHLKADLDGIETAIAEMEHSFSAEKQACFRLGQMDMQESAVAALLDAAQYLNGNAQTVLRSAAELVRDLEVGADD